MEPELLFKGIWNGSWNSLKKLEVSISNLLFFLGLYKIYAFSSSGEDAMSSYDAKVSFLSEPERQLRVWKELRRTNRLEF